MPIKLEELLSQIPQTYEKRLIELQKKERQRIGQALLAECRLTLNPSGDLERDSIKVKIPIHYEHGCPYELRNITFDEDILFFHKLVPYKRYLEGAGVCAAQLVHLIENHSHMLESVNIEKHFDSSEWANLVQESISTTSDFSNFVLKNLIKRDPFQQILSVREDVLGAYVSTNRDLHISANYKGHKNALHNSYGPGTIILYWAVIGLFSLWMDCEFDDLSLVVLIHELAHAYTQIGCDIQGRRWDPAYYSNSDSEVKEGLAQYYTHRVLNRNKDRYSGAFEVFKKMMDWQDPKYQVHKKWMQDSTPEAVRYALLAIRNYPDVTIQYFDHQLREAGRVINGDERG